MTIKFINIIYFLLSLILFFYFPKFTMTLWFIIGILLLKKYKYNAQNKKALINNMVKNTLLINFPK